jgi:hypothetical protein
VYLFKWRIRALVSPEIARLILHAQIYNTNTSKKMTTTRCSSSRLFFFAFFFALCFFSSSSVFVVARGEEEEGNVPNSRSASAFKVSRTKKTDDDVSSSVSSSSSSSLLADASTKKHGEEIQFPLWHSLEYPKNDGEQEEMFVKVGTMSGTIVLDSKRQQESNGQSSFRLKEIKVHREEMTASEKAKLQELAKRGHKYRIRVPSNVLAPSGTKFAQAASAARCVVTSRLRESFTLHMDDNGNVLAVDYEAECPVEVHLVGGGGEGSLGEEGSGDGDEDASLFIADGAQFRSVATARFPKRAPQLNADAAMTDVRGHGGPMDAKKAQEVKARRARGEKVDATTKDLTYFQRNYWWLVPVGYFMFMNAVQGEQPRQQQGQPAPSAAPKKTN